jgi:hypothetical protein
VADYFIDLGEIAERVRKEVHGARYDERELHEPQPPQYLHERIHVTETEEYQTMRVVVETAIEDNGSFDSGVEFIRVTDDQ